MEETKLIGKVIINGVVELKTGLRIGGTTTGLKIGGVDLNVITDPSGKPYIPGSSLKGKMRSLIERKEKVSLNIPDKHGNPMKHECQSSEDYKKCPVCKIWGILGSEKIKGISTLTRLIVRDTCFDETSITDEMEKNLDLKYTEIKTETAINRSTGTALGGSLRQMERVPAGARFKDCEMVFNIFEEEDKDLLKKVFEAMELLEDDYLGGMGSRGYGKIAFKDIKIYWNKKEDYESGELNQRVINEGLDTPIKIVKNFNKIENNLNESC